MTIETDNHAIFCDYLVSLDDYVRTYSGINPFWQRICNSFHETAVKPKSREEAAYLMHDLMAAVNAMPGTWYLIEPIGAEEFDREWQAMMDAAAPLIKDKEKAKALPLNKAALAVIALMHYGVLEEARQFLRAARIKPFYNSLRHYYYLSQLSPHIRQLLARQETIDVLEIGAGGGMVMQMLKHRFGRAIRSYTVIDLPEMMCISCYASMHFHPGEKLHIVRDASDALPDGSDNIFVPASLTHSISPRGCRFDLFLNTHSFQEMDDGIIADYFSLIYETARDGAIFFNTNWGQSKMTRLNGSVYNNDPNKYPYRKKDVVLFWKDDPFHGYLRQQYGLKSNTSAITSIRQLTSAGMGSVITRKVAKILSGQWRQQAGG